MVCITLVCSTGIDDRTLLVTKRAGVKEPVNIPMELLAETEEATAFHYDDAEATNPIGEGRFGIVYKGTIRGNDVAIKKMMDVDVTADTIVELAKEITTLDYFHCEQTGHFYGVCFILGHIMTVTEFAHVI